VRVGPANQAEGLEADDRALAERPPGFALDRLLP